MANNYVHFSIGISTIEPIARDIINALIYFSKGTSDHIQPTKDNTLKSIISATEDCLKEIEDCSYYVPHITGILFSHEPVIVNDKNTVYIWDEAGQPDPYEFCVLLKNTFKHHGVNSIAIIEYAVTCSKPRPGEFGGGVYVVDRNSIYNESTVDIARRLFDERKRALLNNG